MRQKLSFLKSLLTLCLAVVLCQSAFAQKESNYIYILDCSNSMLVNKVDGRPLWDVTLDFLNKQIKNLVPGTKEFIEKSKQLKQVKSSDFTTVVYDHEPEVLSTIDIKPQNLAAVKTGMLMLTTEGSVAKYFQNLGVKVGAKTGSAQISSKTESNAVFVCFAPYDKPEVAVAIVVEHGGSGSELGAIAAQVLGSYFTTKETHDDFLGEDTLIR